MAFYSGYQAAGLSKMPLFSLLPFAPSIRAFPKQVNYD
jgi:hypothetical protein